MTIVRPESEPSGPLLTGAVAGLTVGGGAGALVGVTVVVVTMLVVGAAVVVVAAVVVGASVVVVGAVVVAVARRRGAWSVLPIATATPASPSTTIATSSAMSCRRLIRHARSKGPGA
jgi:hypothetical protein